MFNLFSKTDEPTIICALRDGAALPGFLRGHCWAYSGKVRDIRNEQFEFDKNSIDSVLRQTGYYIYTRM